MSSWLAGKSVAVEHLIALNDEMVALVKAGIPLERGLIRAGRDFQGRLGSLVGELGQRLERGERLADVLAASDEGFPRLYASVVEAGIRSGELARALEGLADLARHHVETRRTIALALLYPMVILLLGYGALLAFLVLFVPRLIQAFSTLGLPKLSILDWFGWLGETSNYWAPIPPLLVLLALGVWYWSGRSSSLDLGVLGPVFQRLPVLGTMVRFLYAANYADLMALLLEHQVPMQEAARLAGEASGDRRLRKDSEAMAEAIDRGEPLSEAVKQAKALPSLLAWILSGSRGVGELSRTLRHASETYRRQAGYRENWLRSFLPTTLLITIGASVVVVYGLIFFLPLSQLLQELATAR